MKAQVFKYIVIVHFMDYVISRHEFDNWDEAQKSFDYYLNICIGLEPNSLHKPSNIQRVHLNTIFTEITQTELQNQTYYHNPHKA
jgi:hypothetical protein